MKILKRLQRFVYPRTISIKILRKQFHRRRDMAIRYHKRKDRHPPVPTIREEFTARKSCPSVWANRPEAPSAHVGTRARVRLGTRMMGESDEEHQRVCVSWSKPRTRDTVSHGCFIADRSRRIRSSSTRKADHD